jgi:hypothetical protein
MRVDLKAGVGWSMTLLAIGIQLSSSKGWQMRLVQFFSPLSGRSWFSRTETEKTTLL